MSIASIRKLVADHAIRARLITASAVGVNLAIIGYYFWFMFSSVGDLRHWMRWVDHTLSVSRLIERPMADMAEVESQHRGYMITGHGVMLVAMETAREKLVRDVDRLELSTADNPRQQANVDRLRQFMYKKFEFLDELIVERAKGPQAHYDLDRGFAILIRFRSVLDEMGAEELRLLQFRTARRDAIGANVTIGLWIMVGMNVAIFGAVFYGAGMQAIEEFKHNGHHQSTP